MPLGYANLHTYQIEAAEFAIKNRKCALWLGLGLGKTIATLTALAELSDAMEIDKTLVIAPLRVANTVWHREIRNWAHTRHLTYSIVTGSAKERRAALMRTADIYIINRENVTWLVKGYRDKWPFDCVVIDEASSFKSQASERWKALRRVAPYTHRMIQLTATPSSNGLMDVWAQIFLLDVGKALGRTITWFRQQFFNKGYDGYSYEIRDGADEDIYRRIQPLVLSMKTEDYLDMPPKVELVETVTLTAKEMKIYNELEKEFMLTLEKEVITAANAAVLTGKLLQFCNGALYTDEMGNYQVVHDRKLDVLEELADENEAENILVAYNFKSDLARLQARFPHAVVMDKEGKAVDEWNEGKIKMLLVHPASAGHGLNLQHGGSLIVWFGLTWSLELYQQLVGRLYRQGQLKPVRIVHLVAEGCMDERVMRAILSKAETQAELLAAMVR